MHVNKVTEMIEDNSKIMDDHGITSETRNVYHYKEFKYERLADAVGYAKIDAERHRLNDLTS